MNGDQHDDDARQPINDPLTGAYSRALLGPRLAEELSRASRSSTGCSLFLFDVDYFKSVNDAYGHPRGDDILRQLTERIHGLIRGYDVLFRYGGDEFVLLLPETGKADATRVALRLTEGVKATPFPGEPPLSVSVSLGVATFPDDAVDAEGLLAAADRRNYLAKHRGRACAVADDVESDSRPSSSRLLERDLPLGITREFLTRVVIGESGALRVTGEAGAGFSRFFEEVARAGRLRGFHVIEAADPDQVDAPGGPQPILVVLDAEPDDRVLPMVDRLRAAEAPGLGLVYRAQAGRVAGADAGLPVHDTAELLAWSTAAIRVWLRTTLQGEPSGILIDWLAGRTAGLPARVAHEVERLTERGGLVRDETGWTLAPAVLRRTTKQRRPLPTPMTELVGRQQETAQVAQLVADGRLVTLVGPGGIGKTRLSLAVAAAVAGKFEDGVAFVPLEAARTEDEVLAALARAIDVGEVPGRPLLDTLVEHLGDQSVLVVFDNFEQAHEAADVLAELLAVAQGLKVLVSSRVRLGLYGEQAYPVPPLSTPRADELRPTAAGVAMALAGSPAMALFQARARAAAYDFAITTENVVAVAALCHRLDGLPLAIELAAAHSDQLSPAEMLEQLTDRLDLPGGAAPRGVPRRQQTLRDAIDWSFRLLDRAEQDLFLRMGVFRGGARPEAIAAVSPQTDELTKRLGHLVDKSLVRVEPDDGEAVRYALLETVRAYAAEILAEGGLDAAARDAHATHYTDLADRAGAELIGPDQAGWMTRVEREHENLRAAFERHLAGAGGPAAARLAAGLWRFWRNAGRLREGRQWLGRLLDEPVALPDAARARVLHAAAVLAAAQDDHAAARDFAGESLARARAAGDARTVAQAGNALGIAEMTAGQHAAAREHFNESLAVWRELGDPVGMAMAHGNLTMVALRLGDIEVASEHAVQCLRLEREQGNTRGIMLGLLCLGEIELSRGDLAAAEAHLDEARTLSRSAGDVFGEAMALHQLGLVAVRSGDRDTARRRIAAALILRRDADDRGDLAESLETLADVLAAEGAAARLAARLVGAAQTLRARYQLPVGPAGETVARLREWLTPETLEQELETGRYASLDAIVDEAVKR